MFERLKHIFAAPEAKASRTAQVLAFESGGRARWTPRDYAALAREGYVGNAIVHRAVKLVAENAASVRYLVYEGAAVRDAHPLLDLLARPNPRQEGAAFLEAICAHLLIAGNAYIEAVTLDGQGTKQVRELHALRPDRMRVVPGADGWPEAYDYVVAGRTLRFSQDAEPLPPILHLSQFHPLDDHYGLASMEAAAVAVEGGDGDLRYKLSKESSAKTLSFLFQNNYSGRAEFGLVGDDDFRVKVSPDGSSWYDGLAIARSTGVVSILPTTAAVSAATGALKVAGGLGVAGAAYIGGVLNAAGASTLAALSATTGAFSSTLAVTGATTLSSMLTFTNNYPSELIRLYNGGASIVYSIGIGSGGMIFASGDQGFVFNNNNQAASGTGGATLVTIGHTGIVAVSNTAASTSSSTGAMTVAGGIGVAGEVWAGSAVHFGSGGSDAAGSLYADSNWGLILHAYTPSPAVAEFMFANAAGTERVRIGVAGGMVIGAPTGGDKGAGTLNATAVYDDNTLLTCFGIEYLIDGKIDLAKWDGYSPTGRNDLVHRFSAMIASFDPRDHKQYVAKMLADRALPGMPLEDEWRPNTLALGEMHNRLWLSTELLASAFAGHVSQTERRLAALEVRHH